MQVIIIILKMSTLPLLLVAMVTLTRAAGSVLPDKPTETEEIRVFKSRCPLGWSPNGQRCFRFVPRRMVWVDALRNCQSMGGSLASVHSAGEYRFIQNLIAAQTHSHPQAWLGGTDLGRERLWRWTDGTPFRFSFWCRGEPNNVAFQHCMQMNYSGGKCWDDLWCNHHRGSVCVRRM